MTQTTRTPGPWYRDGTVIARDSIQGDCIAVSESGEANAQLIAAAPELLEALVKAELLMAKAGYDTSEQVDVINKAKGV